MKKAPLMVLIFLFLQNCSCYFLNLGKFLKPVLDDADQLQGQEMGYSQEQQMASIGKNNIRVAAQKTVSKSKNGSGRASQNKRNKPKKTGPSRNKYQWFGRKKNERNQLRERQFQAIDLFQEIGIPYQVIDQLLMPVYLDSKYRLNSYFYKGSNSKKKLYSSLQKLKSSVEWMTRTYLNQFNSLIFGENNVAVGDNILLKGSNHVVIGNNNYVFNNQFGEDVMKGNNVVRIDRFDVYLDKIDRVLTHPEEAIVLLQQ